jgi:hypothetical protein
MTERTIKIPRPNDPISAAMPTLDVCGVCPFDVTAIMIKPPVPAKLLDWMPAKGALLWREDHYVRGPKRSPSSMTRLP